MPPSAENRVAEPGTLYLVATPIGNMGDITLRALETLRLVDVVASEDTRKTGNLLEHHGIKKPQVSFHTYNEEKAGERVVGLLREGKSVALVTNSGTPGISDPGFSLVRRALQADVAVTMAPGPAAFVMALVLSNLPAHSFTFLGFLPRKPGKRRNYLATLRQSPHTLVFYESPYRLVASLRDAITVLGDRPAAVANDLTKKFERLWRGRLSDLAAQLGEIEPKGEFVVVIAASAEDAAEPYEEGDSAEDANDL
ncbi:MAG: 16S rRNA (cytidine(1402)-2'-O)-methyltransferase [Anaerolineae bacterium]